MESLLRDINELSPTDRQAVEALLGHQVGPKGLVFIAVMEDLTSEQRSRWEALMAAVSRFHRNVAASGATQNELESEIDQAIAEIRSGQH